MKTKTSSISTPVTELQYGPTGISDGVHGELCAAPAYGDLTHGPHGTFIKMPAGYVSPTHTHTEDYWAVVVSGAMVNKKPDGPDVPLPAGSYFFQKGGRTTRNQVHLAGGMHLLCESEWQIRLP